MKTPIPFYEDDLQVFWKKEPFDAVLPSEGFITDVVASLRGVETPTITAAWSAIFALSSVMKRDSYYVKHPGKLYPNLYVVVVGPPRLVGKSQVVNYIDENILSLLHEEFEDPYLQILKRLNLLRSRATPEALNVALQPETETIITSERKLRPVDRGSQLVIIASELATFLGKQKYNQGMITKLLNLYDCKASDDDLTISRGSLPIRNVYVTLFGATTRDQLGKTISEDALGSGFLSRAIFVYTDKPTRVFPKPIPTRELDGTMIDWNWELRQRLAWIAENSIGEYTLSKEAQEFHDDWYLLNRKSLIRKIDSKETELRSRLDIHLMKLAMIFRAQRYEKGQEISLQDMDQAKEFLLSTYERSYTSLSDATAAGDFNRWLTRVSEKIKEGSEKNSGLLRTSLAQAMSPYGCKAADLNTILHQLEQENRIKVQTPKGQKKFKAGDEVYLWKKGLGEGL